MEGLRLMAAETSASLVACSRCQATGCPWDRIAGKPICPDCQEQMILGETPPLLERVEKHACAVCQHTGTLRYLTFPLRGTRAVEIDLCSNHFQALLARRLDRYALKQFGKQLQGHGIQTQQLFLLHEAFYDDKGQPLQPVPDAY
jgi:hypothetical protein